MATKPSIKSDQPLDFGWDGEAQFDRLRASIEHGQGFELFFCGFDSPAALSEVKRRLAAMPPAGNIFEPLPLEGSADLRTMAERLAAIGPARFGRKIVFAARSGWEEEVKAEWAMALRRLNERRNLVISRCPNGIVLAGPSWLPWLAHDEAPDLWSVRTAVFTFPVLPASRDRSAAAEPQLWRSGLPMAHELQPPTYYEELAAALEASRRPGEQGTLGRLLLRASAAWELRGDYDDALRTAIRAKGAFAEAHEEVMVATAMGYVADILQARGELDEALRIRREEQLPVYERMGLARDLAIGRANLALMLIRRGESGDSEEAARLLKLALEATQSMGLPEAEPIRDLIARLEKSGPE